MSASTRQADGGPSLDFEELLRQLDEQFAVLRPSLIERFRFELDGIKVDVRRVQQTGKGYSFVITATLGYLPFTIESAERRQSIRTIVEGACGLPHLRFSIDHASKITVGGVFDVAETVAPDFIFYPLTLFLQEARPFIQLIGRYL